MSLFPNLWAALSLALCIGWGVDHYAASSLRKEMATVEAAAAQADAKYRRLEADSAKAIADQSKQLEDAQHAATAQINSLRAGLRSGAVRLSVPAQGCGRAGPANSPAATVNAAGAGRAELDGATSEALIGITSDGDTAIRERNACIDAYQTIRRMYQR